MGAKKISIDDFKGLSKDTLLGLTEKYFDKERIVKHLVKEFENSPEADIVLEELQIKKQKSADILTLNTNKKIFVPELARQFISEIENYQEKVVNDQKVEQEFVREIEQLQQKQSQMAKLVNEIIDELDKSEDQLSKQIDTLNSVSKRNLKLNDLYKRLKESENLTEADQLQEQFEKLMQEQLNELSFYTAITGLI